MDPYYTTADTSRFDVLAGLNKYSCDPYTACSDHIVRLHPSISFSLRNALNDPDRHLTYVVHRLGECVKPVKN